MPNGTFGSMTPEDPVPTRLLNGDPGEGLRDERTSPNTPGNQARPASGMGPIFAGRIQGGDDGLLERLLGVPGAARQRIAEFVAPQPLSQRGGVGQQAAEFDPTRFTPPPFAGEFRSIDPSRDTALRTDPFTGDRGVGMRLQSNVQQLPVEDGVGFQETRELQATPIDPILTEREEIALGLSGVTGIPGAGRAFRAVESAPGAFARAGRALPGVDATNMGARLGVRSAVETGRALPGQVVDDILSGAGRVDRGQLQMLGGRTRLGPEDVAPPQRNPPISAEDVLPPGGGSAGPAPSTLQGIQREQQAVMQAIRARNARLAATNRPSIPGLEPTGVAADFLGRADIPTLSLTDPTRSIGVDPGIQSIASGTGITGIQTTAPASALNRPTGTLQVPEMEQMFVPGARAIQSGREFIRQPTDIGQRGGLAQRQSGLTMNIPRFDIPGRAPPVRVPPRPTRTPPRTPRIPGVPPLPPIGFGGGGVFAPRDRRRFPFGFVNVQSPAFPGTNIRILPSGEVIQLPEPGQNQGMQPRDPVTGQFVEA